MNEDRKMEDFRKLAKIAALNQEIPGPVCGNPDCEDLCAEAYDAALSLRLDPVETIHKTIERELHCLPADTGDGRACRFGFIPASNSLVLSAKKRKEDNEVIHIFRTGANECEDCRNLNGTEISQEEWANKEKMKEKGFPFTENDQYVPHPNCKCHWEEEKRVHDEDLSRKQGESGVTLNRTTDNTFEGKEVEFRVAGAPGRLGIIGGGSSIDGFEEMLSKLEKNYPPHSTGLLRIIGHGKPGTAAVGLVFQDAFSDLLEHDNPINRKKVARLRKMLSNHAMLELRMCNVGLAGKGPGENGPVFAQKLANLLWCRVKVYLEPVNAYGLNPDNFFRPSKYEIYQPCL